MVTLYYMLVAILIPVAHAATLGVGTPEGYTSIGAAIEASADGDRIEVSSGTYNESVTLDGKAITLISVDGPAETFISGVGTPTITLDDGEGRDSVISGFTVRSEGQNCIYIETGSPHLENLVIEGCGSSASMSGGGIVISAASPTIHSSTFRNNRAEMGAAAHIGPDSSVTFEDCSFGGNQAQTGGSISANNAEVDILNSDFSGGIAETGGAIAVTDTTMTIRNSRFNSNEARFGTAGAIMSTRSLLFIDDADFEGNRATYNGGAILAEQGTLTIDNSRFLNNVAAFGVGGAIRAYETTSSNATGSFFDGNHSAYGGGAFAGSSVTDADFVNTEFTENTVEVSGGGGAILVEYSGLSVGYGSLVSNSASFGGAVAGVSSDIAMDESSFDRNTSSASGAGLHVNRGSLTVESSTFFDNQAYEHAGAIYSSAIETTVNTSVFSGNQSTGGDGGALYLTGAEASVADTSLFGNWARTGGAIYATRDATETDASILIQFSAFQENDGLYDAGGLLVAGPIQLLANHNTFIGNVSLSTESTANIRIESPDSVLHNNIIAWGVNGTGIAMSETAAATTTFRYNNVFENLIDYLGFEPAEDTGNISLNPRFIELSFDNDFDNDDLFLRPDSPCLDAADPEFDSPSADIGAFGIGLTLPSDEDGDGYSPELGEDCDDTDAGVHIAAVEICDDEIDNDCDLEIDEFCVDPDTGNSGDLDLDDTGTYAGDSGDGFISDTGEDAPGDTGTAPVSSGRDDTADPGTQGADLYSINGKGCSCSSTIQSATGLWWGLLPLILFRRRPA